MKLWMPDVVKGSEKDNILYRLQYTNQFKNRIKTELKEENWVKNRLTEMDDDAEYSNCIW